MSNGCIYYSFISYIKIIPEYEITISAVLSFSHTTNIMPLFNNKYKRRPESVVTHFALTSVGMCL